MPANPGVDDGRSRRFNRFGQFGDFRQRAAVVDQIEHRQAVDDNEIVAGALAHRLNHFNGETHAPGIIAAPLVVALVGARGEKFVNQIALRAHHLDAVIACFPRQLGAVGKIIDQREDLVVAQLMRGEPVNRRLQRRGGDQRGLVAVAPGVQDLQGDFTAFLMYRIGDLAMMRQMADIVEYRAAGHGHPGRGGRDAAGDDQRHAVPRALGVKGR